LREIRIGQWKKEEGKWKKENEKSKGVTSP
jgi:hypothetical protein